MNLSYQLIGLAAFIVISISYWQKKKEKILFFQIISYILYTIHFYLLNALSGAIMDAVGIIGLIFIYYKDKKNIKSIFLLFLICFMYLTFWYFTYENIFSIFALIGGLLPVIILWQNKSLYIRIVGIISIIAWIIYDIYVGSWVCASGNVLFLTSTLLSIYKLNIKRKH